MYDSVQFPFMNFFTRLFLFTPSIYAVAIQCLVIIALTKLSNVLLKTFIFLFYTVVNKLQSIFTLFLIQFIFSSMSPAQAQVLLSQSKMGISCPFLKLGFD